MTEIRVPKKIIRTGLSDEFRELRSKYISQAQVCPHCEKSDCTQALSTEYMTADLTTETVKFTCGRCECTWKVKPFSYKKFLKGEYTI